MDEKYWFQGLSYTGMVYGSVDPGTVKYWFQGLSASFIGTVAPPPVTTVFRRTLSEYGTRTGSRQMVNN